MQLYIQPNIVHSNEHNIPEVYIVQLFVSGGGIKPVPLEYFGEENLYLRNFPYFLAKIEHFFEFFEKLQLKNEIKSNFQGGLGQEFKFIRFLLSRKRRKKNWEINLFHLENIYLCLRIKKCHKKWKKSPRGGGTVGEHIALISSRGTTP